MERIRSILTLNRSSSCKQLAQPTLKQKFFNRKSAPTSMRIQDESRTCSGETLTSISDRQKIDFGGVFEECRKTLVLDLDETLIHTQGMLPPGKFHHITLESNGQFFVKYVIPRPGLVKFLQRMSKLFNICLYTCGDDIYAKKVVEVTEINKYIYAVYSRSSCKKLSDQMYLKDIWSLGLNPRDTIFVDDYYLQICHHLENAVQIKAFEGQERDTELRSLTKFLRYMVKVEEVRPIAKHYNAFVEDLSDRFYSSSCKKICTKTNDDSIIGDECQDVDEGHLQISDVRVFKYNGSCNDRFLAIDPFSRVCPIGGSA